MPAPTSQQTPSSSSSHRHLEIPDEIPGGFSISQEIGRGSFAVVYRGLQTRTRQTVAIKAVIKSKLTSKLFQNLQEEINILKKIRHGNVVGLVDCTSNDDYIFLIMQYCSYGDLSVYIKSQSKNRNQPTRPDPNHFNNHNNLSHGLNIPSTHPHPSSSSSSSPASPSLQPLEKFPHPQDGGLNEWVIRSFLGQLADALHFLRSHSIIHRDIKPQNLLLHPSSPSSSSLSPSPSSNSISQHSGSDQPPSIGRPRYVPEGIPILRVADFGFARVLAPNAGLAETLCGSPLYMAPEILRYEKYDAKADLWSVGAVLYEMAVGKPPFRAQNHVELLRKIEKNEDKIAFPDDKVVAEDLKRLIRSLLKRNPSERVSFEEFFSMADEVSRVGPLIAPFQSSPTPSLPASSTPLHSQLTTQHSTSVQAQQNRSPCLPSTSALPNPAGIKTQATRPASLNPFDGELGAFIVDKNSKNTLQNFARPQQSSLPPSTINQVPQSRQVSLPNPPSSFPHPGNQAPSPSALPAPLPSAQRHSSWMPSFRSKYVVSGASTSNPGAVDVVSTAIKSRDYAVVRSPSLMSSTKQDSSIGPSMTTQNDEDDDRDLGTEYVVVEKGSVEINAMVDGLSSSPQKPMSIGRRMSRGFMSARPTLAAALGSSPHRTTLSASPPPTSLVSTQTQYTSPVSSFPPRPQPAPPSPIPTATHPMNIANFGRSSPSSHGYYATYPSSPQSFDSSGGGAGGMSSIPIVGKYFPQNQSPVSGGLGSINSSGGPPSQALKLPLSFPSSTLCRAILAASPVQNVEMIPPRNTGYGGTTLQHQLPRSAPSTRAQLSDPVENQLLSELEDFACKALVIIQFADEKLNKVLPPPPSALTAATSSTSDISPAAFSGTMGAFITPQQSHTLPSSHRVTEPSHAHNNNNVVHYPQHGQQRNTSDSIQSSPSDSVIKSNHKTILASEALVLYMKALAFLNKAIRHGVAVVNWKKQSFDGRGAGSLGFSFEIGYAIEWLRNKFNEVFDKAEFVKTRVNGKSLMAGRVSADKLIYDRALEKSRSAAVKELVGDKLVECEIEYEASLWMLYGLLDQSIIKTDEIFQVQTNLTSSSPSNQQQRQRKRADLQRRNGENERTEDNLTKTGSEGRRGLDNQEDHLDPDEDFGEAEDQKLKVVHLNYEKIISSILVRLDTLRKKIKASSTSK